MALGLVLALAGSARATLVTVHYNGPSSVVSNGYYVGPYSLSVNPNPVTGGAVAFDALPCISALLHVAPPYDWSADLYSGADFSSPVNVPATGTTAITLNQAQVWKAYYLSGKFGTWTNGSLVGANTGTWGAVHSALWYETGYTPFSITSGSPTTAGLVAEADGAYGTRTLAANSAELAADLANFWVLVPHAAVDGLTPQPFLVAKSNWEEHNEEVPEPSTWALLIMGVAMTAMACAKRRQTA